MSGLLLTLPALNASETVDYAKDIAPLLAKNCVACHNAKTAEGGLNLESHSVLMAGGDSGESIVSGNVDESYLYARASGAEEPVMPPEDNSVGAKLLNEAELELMRTWITEGASASEAMTQTEMKWQPLPGNLQPVYALDSSPDGQHVAFGHGNSLILAPTSNGSAQLEFLVDSSLDRPRAAHLDIVQSIAFSPDSLRIATGGFRTVKIWRKRTEATPILAGLSHTAKLSVLSADGKLMAYTSHPSALEITNIESGLSHRFLKSHAEPISAVTWLGDSHELVSCDETGTWNRTHADTNQVKRIDMDGHVVAVGLVPLSADHLLAVDGDGRVFRLSLAPDAKPVLTPLPELSGITHLIGLGSSGRLLAVSVTGKAILLDGSAEQVQNEFELGPNIVEMAASPNGSLLAVRRTEGPIEVWQVADGKLTAKLQEDYHVRQQVRTADRQVTRQNNWLEVLAKQVPALQKASEKEVEAQKKVAEAQQKATEALTNEAKAAETAQSAVAAAEQAVAEANAAIEAAKQKAAATVAQLEKTKSASAAAEAKRKAAELELTKRNQALATATESAQRAAAAIPVLESKIAAEKTRLASLESSLKGLQTQVLPPPPVAVAFSDDRIAVASQDQIVRVYASNGKPLANLPTADPTLALHLQKSSRQVLALTTAGDLLSWDLDLAWDLEKTIGSDLQSPLSDRVTALDFSPNGQLLAIGSGPPSRSGEVKILDLNSGELRDQFGDVHSDTVFAISFSPDGRQIATGSADKLCKLFDTQTGKLIRSFEGHTHHVLDVSWRDDGQQLATASADATVKLWNVDSGSQDRTISAFKKEPTSLAFVGQSHQLAIAAADGSVRLVNADDGKVIRNYAGATDALFRVATIGSDKQILAGGQAGRVWTWQIEDAKLLRTLPPSTP